MRHLNSGEIKLFNMAKDIRDTKNSTKSMSDEAKSMARKLDTY